MHMQYVGDNRVLYLINLGTLTQRTLWISEITPARYSFLNRVFFLDVNPFWENLTYTLNCLNIQFRSENQGVAGCEQNSFHSINLVRQIMSHAYFCHVHSFGFSLSFFGILFIPLIFENVIFPPIYGSCGFFSPLLKNLINKRDENRIF